MRRKNKELTEFEVCLQKEEGAQTKISIFSNNSIMRQNILKTTKALAKYTLLFLALLVLANAKISGAISPLAVGFAFSLLCLNYNPLTIGPLFLAAQIATNPTLANFVISLCCISAMLLAKGLTIVTKKQVPIYLMPPFQLFGLVGYIYFNISSQQQIVQTIAYIVISILFCYISYTFLRASIARGVLSSFSLDENICFALLVISFALGISNVYIFNLPIGSVVTCLAMLITCKIIGGKYSLYLATLSGLGCAFASGSLVMLAVYCAWAVAITASGSNKYLVSISVLVSDFIMGAYFGAYPIYTYMNVISIIVPSIVFCAIPNKTYQKIARQISISKNVNGALLTNLSRELLQKKLQKTSKLFENMAENYQKIALSENKIQDPVSQISAIAIERACKNCENHNICLRAKNMQAEIANLTKQGLEKGKVTLLDLNENIMLFCNKTTSLLSAINHEISAHEGAEKILQAYDSGKAMVCNQFYATSKLIGQMADSITSIEASYSTESDKIFEELVLNDIVAKDIQVLVGKNIEITLIVKSNENEQQIEKILSKLLKIKLKATSSYSKFSGYKLLKLEPMPKYDVTIGVASSKKEMSVQNGDNYSIVDLDDNKIMVAICDGMGSGLVANEISERVLDLVENFYRAGFESEVILQNVMQLLSVSEKELFATLDICIFDKNTGNADFLKSSAPPSVCKGKEIATLIHGESLPIGIVGSTADTSMKILQSGDIVVLASDGVVDSFASDEEYAACINSSKIINMSLFSENLLQEAKERKLMQPNEIKPDDMTIVALRVI